MDDEHKNFIVKRISDNLQLHLNTHTTVFEVIIFLMKKWQTWSKLKKFSQNRLNLLFLHSGSYSHGTENNEPYYVVHNIRKYYPNISQVFPENSKN